MVGKKNIKVYTIFLEVRFTTGQRGALTTVIKNSRTRT